jgi:hypothetical protein
MAELEFMQAKLRIAGSSQILDHMSTSQISEKILRHMFN